MMVIPHVVVGGINQVFKSKTPELSPRSSPSLCSVFQSQTMSAVGGGAQSLHNVFVYGSLMADDVVRVLLNRVPPSSPAILKNHHRYSIRERVYPAIVPLETKKVAGKVLMGITDPELYVLDMFEDVEYERSTVEVSLTDNSKSVLAHAYIWSNKNDPNLYGEWDFEEWKRVHMNDFMKMTMGFKEELELPDSKSRVATYESFFPQDDENRHTS